MCTRLGPQYPTVVRGKEGVCADAGKGFCASVGDELQELLNEL